MSKIEANPDIDPKELEASRMRWHGFTTMIKYRTLCKSLK